MISEERILELTNKYQTSKTNVRREYFQHLFLSYFYQLSKSTNIYFKGGTALRLLYQSPRFSEDLDFNCSSIDKKEIEDLVLDTLSQIEKENISFTLKEAKETTGGFLAIILFKATDQIIDIKLEISRREEEKKDMLSLALKTLNETGINFETELKQFLPKSHWLIMKDFKETLKRELQRNDTNKFVL